MSEDSRPAPGNYRTVTPYLIITDAARAIEFYKQVFDATEMLRVADPDGGIRHAEIKIGDSMLMIAGENPAFPEWKSPTSRGGTPVHIYMYVEDPDAIYGRAVAAGANGLLPMRDQRYGDRSGAITDPFGHIWYISRRIADLQEESGRR
jgi:PhnB protein